MQAIRRKFCPIPPLTTLWLLVPLRHQVRLSAFCGQVTPGLCVHLSPQFWTWLSKCHLLQDSFSHPCQNSFLLLIISSHPNPPFCFPRTTIINIYLVSVPGFWHRIPKTLGIFWVIGATFVLLKPLWVGSWMGADHQKDHSMIRNLEFSAPPPILQRGEGLEMEFMIHHVYIRKLL